MKIIPVQQNSLEWLVARSGLPTASEFDNLISPKFEPRKGQMPESYLAQKLAERWIGGPLPLKLHLKWVLNCIDYMI